MKNEIEIDTKALMWGIFSGIGILTVYILFIAVFQGFSFAFFQFKNVWYWIIPLAIGFGTQIGLYTSIKHDATIKTGVKTSGTVSGSSMVICCSHYLFSILPFIGIAGATAFSSFLMKYQKAFFSIGIAASIVGIILMLNHKRKMRKISHG